MATIPAIDELDDRSWAILSESVGRLETAWKAEVPQDLASYLPVGVSVDLRGRILVELVKVDQDYRFRHSAPRPLEEYLKDSPPLAENPEVLAELVKAECLTRLLAGLSVKDDELVHRFPSVADKVQLATLALEALRERRRHTDGNTRPLLPPGAQCGRFEIRAVLGQGGMATVYRAFDPALEREIALKIPSEDLLIDPAARARFIGEARAAAQIRHPNICPIHEVGEVDGIPFLVMAIVPGSSLANRPNGQMDARIAVALMLKLARAIECVHVEGIVHRDIKASNVMIDEKGEPHLMDFGLACHNADMAGQVSTRSLHGTPASMAPEQVNPAFGPVDFRTDVYGLGILLYELVAGHLPFTGSLADVLRSVELADPPPLRNYRPTLDTRVERVCLRAIAKRPSERFQSSRDFADALETCLKPRWVSMQFVRRAMVGVALVLAAGVYVFMGQEQEPQPREEKKSPDVKVAMEEEPGKTPETAIALSMDDSAFLVKPWKLAFPEDRRWFSFRAKREGVLVVETVALDRKIDPYVSVCDDTLIPIVQGGEGGPDWEVRHVVRVSADQTLYVALTCSRSAAGRVLLIIRQPEHEPPPMPKFASARPMTVDMFANEKKGAHEVPIPPAEWTYVVGSIRPMGDVDWFTFTTPRAGTLVLIAGTPYSSLATALRLESERGWTRQDHNRIACPVAAQERLWVEMRAADVITGGLDSTGRYVLCAVVLPYEIEEAD